jgi:hypothetical protein
VRVYILTYKLYLPCGGSFKYASKPQYERVTLFYRRRERDEFIRKYEWAKEKTIEISDIQCFFADAQEITDSMGEIINAI